MSRSGAHLLACTIGLGVLLWVMEDKTEHQAEAPANRNVEGNDFKRPVPANARVSLRPIKDRFIFGEDVGLCFELRNAGEFPFSFDMGGDYRNATRATRFQVEAIHETGLEAPDPYPDQPCLGGLMWPGHLKPGEKRDHYVPLLDYRRLEKPGRYRVTVSHDFGWSDERRPYPSAETTIEIVEPTLDEAKKLVADIDAAQAEAERRNPTSMVLAYRRLTHPIYLPMLVERARAGSRAPWKRLARCRIPGRQRSSSNYSIGPIRRSRPKWKKRFTSACPTRNSKARCIVKASLAPNMPIRGKYLRDKSWRPEFAPGVRAHARRCLTQKDDNSVFRGAFMLVCVGTHEDLPVILVAFNGAVAKADGKTLKDDEYPRPPFDLAELRRAVQMMLDRGAEVPVIPKTPGEKLLFVDDPNADTIHSWFLHFASPAAILTSHPCRSRPCPACRSSRS